MKTIIIVWALLVAWMCFVPPWQERIQAVSNRGALESGVVRMRGCAPLYNPPKMIANEKCVVTPFIDYRRLGIQILGVSVLAGGLLAVLLLTSPARRAAIFSAWKENIKTIGVVVLVCLFVLAYCGALLGAGLLIDKFQWIGLTIGALLSIGIVGGGVVFICYTIWTVLCYAVYRYRSRGLCKRTLRIEPSTGAVSWYRPQSFADYFSGPVKNRGHSVVNKETMSTIRADLRSSILG